MRKTLQVVKELFVSTRAAGDELPPFCYFQCKDSLAKLRCPQSSSLMAVLCCKKLICSMEEKIIQLEVLPVFVIAILS